MFQSPYQSNQPAEFAQGLSESGETVVSTHDNVPLICMTAAIDPQGCLGCMFSPEEREQQYLGTLRYYCRLLLSRPAAFRGIVFVDNSGWNLDRLSRIVPQELRGCVEFLSVARDGYRADKGKSYNEMLGLDKTVATSRLFGEGNPVFLKVTGRYPIRNLSWFSDDLRRDPEPVLARMFRIVPFGPSRGRHDEIVDTRCLAVRVSAWREYFTGLYKEADDRTNVHFEQLAYRRLLENFGRPGWGEFSRPPFILGKQGWRRRLFGIGIPKAVEPLFNFANYYQHWVGRSLAGPMNPSCDAES